MHHISQYSHDFCIHGCKVHHGTSLQASTYVRRNKNYMFHHHPRSTPLTSIMGTSRSLNSFMEDWEQDAKPSVIPWTPWQRQQHLKPPPRSKNKLPICDRGSQYNVQGKGKRQFFDTECHLNGIITKERKKKCNNSTQSLSLGGCNISYFLVQVQETKLKLKRTVN